MNIENTQECFVQLWRRLERTRTVDDEPQEGWNELPLPSLYPRKHRELLRAIVAVRLGISYYRINLRAIDKAYSIVFPQSTPINVNKKRAPLSIPPKGGGK